MAIGITVAKETGTATGTARGTLTLKEIKVAARVIWLHPDFTKTRILWNLRESTFAPSTDDVIELADFAKANSTLRAPAWVAFVVSGDYEFGVVRMFQAYREEVGIQTRVFKDLAAAREWLAISP